MPRHSGSGIDRGQDRSMINDAMFQIEPELKLLEGVVARSSCLAKPAMLSIPLFLAMLAHCSRHSWGA